MRGLAFAASGAACSHDAQAHDFWIEPSTFHPRLAQWSRSVCASDRISSAIQCRASRLSSPRSRCGRTARTENVGGSDHIDPAGFLPADGNATATISYASTGTYIELPPEQFEDYLRLYGLDDVIASRARAAKATSSGANASIAMPRR